MSRPNKQGLDYFPVDVHFLEDIKVRKILRACGTQSVAILISLLSNIYADNGYYLVWDSDMPFLIADKIGVSEGAVLEVVTKAIKVNFFDEELFKEKSILTSRGIQKRFFEAVARRKELNYEKEFLLLNINVDNNSVNVDNNSINVDNNSVNVCNNSQRKEKNRIEKERKEKKENNICSPAANDSPNDSPNAGAELPFDYVFEEAWKRYPKKRGKNQISDTKKREIAKVGLAAMLLAVERYQQEVENVEEEYILNGSTFFRGRYKDYLGEDYIQISRRKEEDKYAGLKEWLDGNK